MKPIPILNYHSISTEATRRFAGFTLPPEMLAQHMKVIADGGYTPITVGEYVRLLLTHAALPERPVILTFDDGFADFYHSALPLLQEFRFRASLFVVTTAIGRTSKWLRPEGEDRRAMLTWAQLSEIQRAGIECGAHSATHIHLDMAKPDEAFQEIWASRDRLEQKLGIPVRSMAYPYGHYTNEVRGLVIQAGYTAACAVRNAMSHAGDDLYALARITIRRGTDARRLADILRGKGLRLAPRREDFWVTAWRQFRRARQTMLQMGQ